MGTTVRPFLRSKSCLSFFLFFFFSKKTLLKVLKHSVILFACFLTANIVCICHYFLRARTSQLSTLSSFLACAGFRCVGLAQKISAHCKRASNTGPMFSRFFFICIFILFLALSYTFVILISSDLEVGYEKLISTIELKPFLSLFVSKNPCYL